MGNYPYDDPDVGYDDYDDEPREDDCDHDDYDADIVTGDATCWRCGYRWNMSMDQVNAEIERQRAYDEWEREQQRPWFRFKQWAGSIVSSARWRWRLLTQRPKPQALDDEIPF